LKITNYKEGSLLLVLSQD